MSGGEWQRQKSEGEAERGRSDRTNANSAEAWERGGAREWANRRDTTEDRKEEGRREWANRRDTTEEREEEEEYFYVHGEREEEAEEEEHLEREYYRTQIGAGGGGRTAQFAGGRGRDGAADPRRPRRHRPESRASDSASIHFLTDDREETRGDGAMRWEAKDRAEIHLRKPLFRHNPPLRMGEVDYSPNDFRQARAAIEDAATRQQNDGPSAGGRRSAGSGRRVRHFGDTTVITEHPDPYSFYWQLDKLKRAEQEQPKSMPPADYVLEDEEEEEEEDEYPEDYLSPDSGVHLTEREPFTERHYARPMREWTTDDPSHFSHYWQVESGQRPEEAPPAELRRKTPESPPPAKEIANGRPSPPKQISVSDVAQQTAPLAEEPLIEEHAFRQTTTRRRVEMAEEEEEEQRGERHALTDGGRTEQRQFVVFPLGQMEMDEGELCDAQRSEEALNRAMAQLRMAQTEDGEEAILEINERELRLMEKAKDENGEQPQQKQKVLSREPLEQIRVWGIHDKGHFAYVSRHPSDNRLLCHVFHCRGNASQAKSVAETLRNACQTVLLRQQSPRERPNSLNSSLSSSRRRRRTRESLLTTPIEEPKRTIRCHFVGVTQVPRATGIETLNEAVDKLLMEVGRERWTQVDVHISPSAIVVFESDGGRRQIASCRVRYLSFLGIGRDVKHCAFIVAQSFDHFVCYVFHADPSAASLAKTIEAACKLRYQKVMDAHLPDNGE
ncbi:hypothetical protein niasHT_030619 [Heterodera trifolii]|uniref:PID domain-containing protein n=1 Tax=Heterodera trifolii TaxID=157864 RepID=A0ABD2I5B0_9BILA